MLASYFVHWWIQFLHPGRLTPYNRAHPHGGSYWFWSGMGSGSPIFIILVSWVMLWWRHHNCHVHRCWRLKWHTHPDHGHPVCKHHHPHDAPSA